MIELIEYPQEDIVAFRMDSTVSEADLKPLLCCMDDKLKRYRRLRLLIEYIDSGGFSLDTLVEDFNHKFGNWASCRKIAIVTFKEWLSQAHLLSYELEDTCLKSFPYAREPEAKRWIRQ